MKKTGIIVSIVLIIALLGASSITYAFYTRAQDDFTISQTAASNASIELTVNTGASSSLRPATANAANDNSVAQAGNVVCIELNYKSLSTISSTSIQAKDITVQKVGLSEVNKNFIKDNLEFTFLKSSTKLDNPTAPNTWYNAGVLSSFSAFDTNEEGYIYVFVRFKTSVTNEDMTESMKGAKIYATVSIEPPKVSA